MQPCVASGTVSELPASIQLALMRPPNFGLSPSHPHYDEMFVTWSLGPILRTRDSDLLAESNADALEKHLEEDYPELGDDWYVTSCDHWGPGWVDHLSFRVLEPDGVTPTKIYDVLKDWYDRLADYPIADESDFSRREYEATLENIRSEGQSSVRNDPPEDWCEQIFGYLWDHAPREMEASGCNGAYPSRAAVEKAMEALNLIDPENLHE